MFNVPNLPGFPPPSSCKFPGKWMFSCFGGNSKTDRMIFIVSTGTRALYYLAWAPFLGGHRLATTCSSRIFHVRLLSCTRSRFAPAPASPHGPRLLAPRSCPPCPYPFPGPFLTRCALFFFCKMATGHPASRTRWEVVPLLLSCSWTHLLVWTKLLLCTTPRIDCPVQYPCTRPALTGCLLHPKTIPNYSTTVLSLALSRADSMCPCFIPCRTDQLVVLSFGWCFQLPPFLLGPKGGLSPRLQRHRAKVS